MRVLTTAAALAACLCVGSANAASISLIAAGIGNGNGEFDVTDVGQVTIVNSGQAAVNDLGRPRALINGSGSGAATDFGDFSTWTDGEGVQVDGWTIYRESYNGAGNAAIGVDGLYGFAPGPFGTTPGGQAFTNTAGMFVVSDAYAGGGLATDTFDFSYLAGSDQSALANFAAFLVFDDTTIVPVAAAGAMNLGGTDRTAGGPNELSATGVAAPGAYSTVRLAIHGQAPGTSINRPLVDNVQLSVNTVPEPGSVALSLLALAGLGAVGMRSRLG